MIRNQERKEELSHIILDPTDDIKLKKVRRGFSEYDGKPLTDIEFKNMLGKVISVGSVISDRCRNAYFLIELTTEYYTPAVFAMLKDLQLEIKTVLSENKIIVKGEQETLQKFKEKKRIPKKVTTPIKKILVLEPTEKVGRDLLELIKKDVDGTKVFSISIRLIDNLKDVEEQEFKKILEEKLDKEIKPQYLKKSKQFICGSSSKRILKIAELPFVKRISRIPRIEPQQISENEIFLKKGSYKFEEKSAVPIICVIDSGVSNVLSKFCHTRDNFIFLTPEDTIGHGNQVASVAIFGEDLINKSKILKQKSKIISFKIDDSASSEKIALDEAIMTAIETYKDLTKIFCLSYNIFDNVDPEVRLDIVKNLDLFIQQNNVVLINSCGNINLQEAYLRKEDYPKYLLNYPVLTPSDAKNIFAVGSVCKTSSANEVVLSKISRMGLHPMFQQHELDRYRFFKPDCCTFGGNSKLELKGKSIAPSPELEIPVISSNGDLIYTLGTSFAAPLIALCFARLYEKYKYKTAEFYKAVMLNKSIYSEVNNLPVFYILDTESIIECKEGIYLNFEGEVTPKYRAEDIKKVNLFECKTVEFYMPEEAESIDIITVHSNNYQFQDLRKYNTRLVVEITKANGKSIKKAYGTASRYCTNTYAHYKFSRNYVGKWKVMVHVETRGIPAEMLKNVKVRFGVSIRINLKEEHKDNLGKIYKKVWENTKQINKIAKSTLNKSEQPIKSDVLDKVIEIGKGMT